MLGSMLAASEEALGEIREIGGRRYHYFRGMGSLKAMNSGSADRYAHEGSVRLVAEGIEALKEIKGSLKEILSQLREEILRELAKVDISRYKNPRQRFVFKVRWEKKLPLNQLLLLPNYSKIIPKDVRLRCNFENKRYNLPLLILLPEGAKELAKNLRKQGFLAVNLGLREGKDSDRFSLLEKVDTKTIRSISSLDREHVVLLNITKNSLELLKNLDLSKIKARLILTNDLVLEGLKQDPNILLVRGDFNSLNTLDLSSFSYKPKIVFSGKISSSGDLAKALAAGADMILYDLSKEKNLELRGVERRLEGEKGALSSAFAYLGARDIKKLQQAARFVRQSQAGRLESLPHSVLSLEEF